MEKASVFPLPVFPRPSTSRPASVSGSVPVWIGNGLGDALVGEDAAEAFRHAEGFEGGFCWI